MKISETAKRELEEMIKKSQNKYGIVNKLELSIAKYFVFKLSKEFEVEDYKARINYLEGVLLNQEILRKEVT